MRLGFTDAEIHSACKVDPWFLAQVRGIVETEAEIRSKGLPKTAGRVPPAEGAWASPTPASASSPEIPPRR